MPVIAWIRLSTVAALSVVVVASGCSSDDHEAAPTTVPESSGDVTAPDPCSLLTVEQIDAATGWVLPAGERPDAQLEGDRVICNWEDLRIGGSVQVQLDRGAGTAGFDRDRAQLTESGVETVTAVQVEGATDAVELAHSGVLTMLVGDDVVQLAVLGTEFDGTEQQLLAADVAAALR